MSGIFTGRRALVTGASGGLGEAIVHRLATGGAHVIVTGRRADVLDRLAETCGAEPLVCDLADRGALQPLLDAAASVDILVSNAALPCGKCHVFSSGTSVVMGRCSWPVDGSASPSVP